ncbi:MAG: hydrogenase formation protein HypD [Candidatus Nanohalobium sp.]
MDSLEFRSRQNASEFEDKIKELMPEKKVKMVHVCGTHENTIVEHGLRDLLPENLEVRMGPGCPVCVTAKYHIDEAVKIAKETDATVATYGDLLKVPGNHGSLEEARSEGGNVEIVTSAAEAVKMAENGTETVFLGVGFETTATTLAPLIAKEPPENFSALISYKVIPPAIQALVQDEDLEVDTFIGPGHVSTIIGEQPYQQFAEKGYTTVITGFEPNDVLYGIAKGLEQLQKPEAEVINAYPRCVDKEGNKKSQKIFKEVFRKTEMDWRGLGKIPDSGYRLKEEYSKWDARKKYSLDVEKKSEEKKLEKACRCDRITVAKATPEDCPLFGHRCTPEDPVGPCMVGDEGMCRAWYQHGKKRGRDTE